jgi:hypothetical protein
MARDPDDWFDEPDLSEVPDRRVAFPEDDWLEPAETDAERGPLLTRRSAVVGLVALIALVVLLAGLAAAGVFSSSSPKPPPIITTTPAATTTPPPTTTTAAVQVPTTPLTTGAKGTQVKQLQRVLKRLGDYTGTVDGDYGPATQQAVAAFQKSAGLTADGIAGPQTLRALARAAGGP